jgi:hypothetical protein
VQGSISLDSGGGLDGNVEFHAKTLSKGDSWFLSRLLEDASCRGQCSTAFASAVRTQAP